ncbi:MAG TPA: CoA transferase, partial [Dehalococcoidia bacterium]|nr:CoA transferase [Dehalococcoidia bacterium]
AAAVLTALHARARGVGAQSINLSQHESMITMLGGALAEWSQSGEVRRWADSGPDFVPSRHYVCSDGRFLALTVANDDEWRRLARHVGGEALARDEDLRTASGRLARRERLDAVLEGWCAGRGAAEAEQELLELGLRVGLVRDAPEIAADPHLRARGAFVTVSHQELGEYETVGPAWRFSATPASVRCGPPCLGEHSRLVFRDLLGLSDAEIDELEAAGISGQTPPEL